MGDNYDDEGEPIVNLDEREPSPEHQPYEDLDDDLDGGGDWTRDRSPTPVHGDDGGAGSSSKPRKRLLKKGGGGGMPGDDGLDDFGLEDEDADPSAEARKRKGSSSLRDLARGGAGREKKAKKMRMEDDGRGRDTGMVRDRRGSGGRDSGGRDDQDDGEREIQELWDTIAGGESEDDQEGVRTVDDDNFIDDTGVDPADRYGSDNERHSPGRYAQAEEGEEDDEIEQLFKGGKKKKKKNDRPRADIGLIVEQFIAEFEVAAEEDANLNRQSKPAINKLMKLPLLIDVLSKKNLQQEFLDHGVLTLLKNWLEPLPDGSMPNMNIRSAVLKLLTDFPIDLEQYDRREQLKKSGLGKVIMFLSKSDEETTANRKLAKELVDKWSRPIFNKSTRFEDMKRYDDERAPYRRPQMKEPSSSSSGMESRDDDLDADFSQRKSGQSSSRQHASRPEASPLDFVIRPQSKIDPEQIRARAKQAVQDQRRLKMNKKLQQLKAPKKKNLQASKLSVEGRGMIKYL
ncbi:IWS1 C-terminus family protein [Zea mays]|uniref:IWS1 C-terminus family protein n=1 Tax=Zea mays TaxID=4577 RepID=B6TBF4_MAIZE|nr:IWS1 C-terminus family protein [Zea mays]ACG34437.1 IWS1 C-terminus family protein [Zea mays]|eukprot:NP_001149167.1 IWS1 C-terminus family protein [Zea mays]